MNGSEREGKAKGNRGGRKFDTWQLMDRGTGIEIFR